MRLECLLSPVLLNNILKELFEETGQKRNLDIFRDTGYIFQTIIFYMIRVFEDIILILDFIIFSIYRDILKGISLII